jgi:hypothetical protein
MMVFGCGGCIAKFIDHGSNAYYVAFSKSEESLPEKFLKNTLKKEVAIANKRL